MIGLVLDASAFAPLLLDDERGQILALLDRKLAEEEVAVPAHWHVEVANALRTAVKLDRIDAAGQLAAVQAIEALRLVVDATRDVLFTSVWPLSVRHDLTIYDGAYLELALRHGVPIASNDHALLRAAKAEGVVLFGR